MPEEKTVKDIMARVDEYNRVEDGSRLCDALFQLRRSFENLRDRVPGTYHKTLLVTNGSGRIVGKLSVFDLIRGLVPEEAKKPEQSRAYSKMMSSRARRAEQELADSLEQFKWLHTTFFDLVLQETQKQVKEVMSPIHPLLKEDDTINKAIYIMFKENVRQPAVMRDDEIVGIVNIMDIFPVLLDIAGDECFLPDG